MWARKPLSLRSSMEVLILCFQNQLLIYNRFSKNKRSLHFLQSFRQFQKIRNQLPMYLLSIIGSCIISIFFLVFDFLQTKSFS